LRGLGTLWIGWPLTRHKQTHFNFFRNTLPSVEGIIL
jgi:hypothetical protein